MENSVIIINRHGMGQADDTLSRKLVQSYLNMLDLGNQLPRAICFYAEGVKLTAEGSHVLEELRSLAAKGVRLIACTTCLNHYQLLDDLRVGTAGSMQDIVNAQAAAEKVITI